MIRLGLVGCGEHSECGHAIPLARYKSAHPDEILLAAACDVRVDRAREFCSKYGFLAAYPDVDAMLQREKLDGCICVVPPENISALGVKLLHKNIPCVVEKPLGASIGEVRSLRDAAVATQTLNMVSVNRRFMPSLNQAIEWTHTAGPLRYAHCALTRHARREPDFIWATAVHAVDTLRYVAGEVVSCDHQVLRWPKESTAWYAIDLQFENGISGRIDVFPTAGMVEETYDLFGEDFRVSVTCPFGPHRGWRCFRAGKLISEEMVSNSMPEDVVNGCYGEVTEFVRAVSSKSPPRPSIAEIAPSVELCFAIAKAAKEEVQA
jgi:predicted dehydrogenase